MTEDELIAGLVGLVESFAGRSDITEEQRNALLGNHRYYAAKRYIEMIAKPSPTERFTATSFD